MSEGSLNATETSLIDRAVVRGTTWIASVAGVVLAAIAVMTVASIIGRSLIWAGFGPIPGDFELVEIGAAVAVFGFLPYCHLNRGHVTVDILVQRLPTAAFNGFTIVGDLVIAAISIVVAWRLWFGMWEKLAYGESTMILGAPLWLGYIPAFFGAAWMVVVALYVVWRDIRHLRAGERLP